MSLRSTVAVTTACLLVTAGTVAVSNSSSYAQDGIRPGLPRVPFSGLPGGASVDERNDFAWLNVTQVGLAGAIPSQQWIQLPVGIAATNSDFVTRDFVDENGSDNTIAQYDIFAFLVPSSANEPYGRSPDIPVRTVAFGSIPTEVTVQLRQRRDADDLPVGFRIRPEFTTNFTEGRQIYPPTDLVDDVEIVVKELTVDGVPVELTGTCSSGDSARLDLASDALVVNTGAGEQFRQDRGFSGLEGGTFEGTLDIPAFSGCRTASGDDLSPLLTSAISADSNPVRVTVGIIGCFAEFTDQGFSLPSLPGTAPSDAGCPPDQREGVEGIPSLIPIPDTPPLPPGGTPEGTRGP